MLENLLLLLLAAAAALLWGIMIYLVLVRQLDDRTRSRYNCWTVELTVANSVVLAALAYFLVRGDLSWLARQAGLIAMVGELLALSGLLIFLFLVMASFFCAAPRDFDYLLVLGAGLDNGRVPPILAARLDRAAVLWNRRPSARLVLSGGRVHNDQLTEAQAMADYLRTKGISADRLLLEKTALNTRQNLTRGTAKIQKHWQGTGRPTIVAVTSSFHVLRAAGYARRLGLRLKFVAAPTPWRYFPLAAVRDYLGIIRDHRHLAAGLTLAVLLAMEWLQRYW